MQKLSVELKNAPRDTPQVPRSVSRGLNREETLSVQGMVLVDNNPDVDLHSGKSGQGLRVPVLNMRNEPLMPTTPGKARLLLKQNEAEVVRRTPFTIRLKCATGEVKQDITLGIDAGFSFVGFSAVSEKGELLSGELKLRTDISKRLTDRKMYRGTRRGRLWHREPRFLNRKKKKGWLAPSIEHKLQSHIRLIEKIKTLLPITKTIVEVASFDSQKMANSEISGVEYQQGELQGYEVREYLIEKFKRKCVYCGKKNVPLEIEHIIPKSRGGSNRVSNLTISCHKCNQKKGNKTAEEFGFKKVQEMTKKSLKSLPFMNCIKSRIVDSLNCGSTLGYITKHDRIKNGLEKSHVNDAFTIAKGTKQDRVKPFAVIQTRRNNRRIQVNRKGFKPSIRRQRYKFQPNDLVLFRKKVYVSKGVHCKGSRILLKHGEKALSVGIKNVGLIRYGKGLCFVSDWNVTTPPTTEVRESLCEGVS